MDHKESPRKSENDSKSNIENTAEKSPVNNKELVVDLTQLTNTKSEESVEGTAENCEREKCKENGEDEDEDVPGDFFDDFLKEDFMEGLDIVDDDEWDEKIKKGSESENKNQSISAEDLKNIKNKKNKKEKIDHVEKFRQSPPGEKKHVKQRKKNYDKRDDDKKHRRNRDHIDADEFDIRRDPEKTKRDIERDKVRCERDKEKKIITEKLNLVETGLVPPGMEMETDIEEIKRQKNEQNKTLPRDLREHLKRLKRSKSKSPGYLQRSPRIKSSRHRSGSAEKKSSPKRRRTRSPKRTKSAARTSSPKISSRRSPAIRSSQRKGSPLSSSIRRVSPKRSPIRRSSPSLRRSRERSYGRNLNNRRSRSQSPYYRIRRSRYSPGGRRGKSPSPPSDREIWLRRKRSRSRSPRRRREDKRTFLEELAEKLNETRPAPVHVVPQLQPPMHYIHAPQVQIPAPVPAPVPPPSHSFFPHQEPLAVQHVPQPVTPQPQPQFDYDQSFFIGTSQPLGTPNFVGQSQQHSVRGPNGLPQMPLNPLSVQPVNSPLQPTLGTPTGISLVNNGLNRNLEHPRPLGHAAAESPEDISKLFQDKKITLSEFLAITAKPEVHSSSPAHLQEKIKVISRCQEAIKILSTTERRFTGKLIVRRTDQYKPSEEKYKSPLLKFPNVKFSYTEQPKVNQQKASFTNFINELLQGIGLMKDVVVNLDDEEGRPASTAGKSPLNKAVPSSGELLPGQASPPLPPPPHISKGSTSSTFYMNSTRCKLGSNQLSKMVQTDKVKCESCEKRNKITYKSSAVQCGGSSLLFSVTTQVTESDFQPKIPKTQSLASLTPAQLLAKSRDSLDSLGPRRLDIDNRDGPPTNNYRMNFSRTEGYSMSRFSPPESPPRYTAPREEHKPLLPPYFKSPSFSRPSFSGGGERGGNQSSMSRNSDVSNRFGYNNYF